MSYITSVSSPGRCSLVFGAVGFLAAVPFLLRVHRRTGGWRTPAALLILFAGIFSVLTFVIGPAITTSRSEKNSPASEKNSQPTAPTRTDKDIHGH